MKEKEYIGETQMFINKLLKRRAALSWLQGREIAISEIINKFIQLEDFGLKSKDIVNYMTFELREMLSEAQEKHFLLSNFKETSKGI
jgi:hypothetical protein